MNTSVNERAHAEAPSQFRRLVEAQMAKRKELQEQFIQSTRYEPLEIIGKGQWGTVFKARDVRDSMLRGHASYVAIKVPSLTKLAEEQRKARNLDLLKAFGNEHRFKATPNILPAICEIDDAGTPYVLMPLCKRSLEEEVWRDRLDYGNGYVREDLEGKPVVDRWIKGIAAGLHQLHLEYGRAHGDLKLDNILVDERGRVLLSDFGNATMASMPAWSESPRDNMGCLHTRAPELFREGSHPSYQSDVYAAGALFYRLIKGTYPLEDKFRTQAEAETFFAQHSQKEVEKLMKERLKQIPRKYRALLKETLAMNAETRPRDGLWLEERTKEALHTHTVGEQIISGLKRSAMVIGLPIALGIGGYFLGANHYEQEAKMANRAAFFGPQYLPNDPTERRVKFDIEKHLELPNPIRGGFIDDSTIDHIAGKVTKDRATAYLLAQYQRTAMTLGMDSLFNEYQQMNWVRAQPPGTSIGWGSHPYYYQTIIAHNIEYGVKTAMNADGVIDLEDMCVSARLGPHIVRQAQNASGSLQFKDYCTAKNARGEEIIPKKDQLFIKTWLGRIAQY